jgi:hypothetical protein
MDGADAPLVHAQVRPLGHAHGPKADALGAHALGCSEVAFQNSENRAAMDAGVPLGARVRFQPVAVVTVDLARQEAADHEVSTGEVDVDRWPQPVRPGVRLIVVDIEGRRIDRAAANSRIPTEVLIRLHGVSAYMNGGDKRPNPRKNRPLKQSPQGPVECMN